MAMASGKPFFVCELEDVERERKQKRISDEIKDYNKHTSVDHEHRVADKKERDKKFYNEMEDMDNEIIEKEHIMQEMDDQAFNDYEAAQLKLWRERKVHDEEAEEKRERAWRKQRNEQNDIYSEEQRVSDQLDQNQEKHEAAVFKANFDNVQTLQDKERNSYEDFIETGIRRSHISILAEDKVDIELKKHDHESEMSTSHDNQVAAGIEHMKHCKNQCSCQKQSYPCGHPNHSKKN